MQERLTLATDEIAAELVRRISGVAAGTATPSSDPASPGHPRVVARVQALLPQGEKGKRGAASFAPLSPRGRGAGGEGAAISPPCRILVGITGGPGAGKSTLVAQLAKTLNAAIIPMDGFHMRQSKLEALGRAAQKGAPHTFEAEAFADFLETVKTATHPVSGPIYTRDIEDVTENGYTVSPDTRILIAEGNYLLLDTPPWRRIRPLLDLAIHLDVPRAVTRARLLARHAEHGLFSPEHIANHVEQVDLPNYDLVSATARHADLVIVPR